MKDFAIVMLIAATGGALVATPVVFLMLMAFEKGGEHYHWLTLIPLAVIVLIWALVMAHEREV